MSLIAIVGASLGDIADQTGYGLGLQILQLLSQEALKFLLKILAS
jgi:hypothetical protein